MFDILLPNIYSKLNLNGLRRFHRLKYGKVGWDALSEKTVKMNVKFIIEKEIFYLVQNRLHLNLKTK